VRETRPPAHWAYRAIRLYGANGNGVYETALRNVSTDTAFTETVTETVETDTERIEREHNAGNEARPCMTLMRFTLIRSQTIYNEYVGLFSIYNFH